MCFQTGSQTSFYDSQPLSVITVMSSVLTMKSFLLGLLWNMYPCLVRIFWASPRHWPTCSKLVWFWTGSWTRSLPEFFFNLYYSVIEVFISSFQHSFFALDRIFEATENKNLLQKRRNHTLTGIFQVYIAGWQARADTQGHVHGTIPSSCWLQWQQEAIDSLECPLAGKQHHEHQ